VLRGGKRRPSRLLLLPPPPDVPSARSLRGSHRDDLYLDDAPVAVASVAAAGGHSVSCSRRSRRRLLLMREWRVGYSSSYLPSPPPSSIAANADVRVIDVEIEQVVLGGNSTSSSSSFSIIDSYSSVFIY